jgi:hypothetical protein
MFQCQHTQSILFYKTATDRVCLRTPATPSGELAVTCTSRVGGIPLTNGFMTVDPAG